MAHLRGCAAVGWSPGFNLALPADEVGRVTVQAAVTDIADARTAAGVGAENGGAVAAATIAAGVGVGEVSSGGRGSAGPSGATARASD